MSATSYSVALLLRRVELVQGCGPAFAAGVGVLLPPRGTAFTKTALGCLDPRACCGHRRVVVGSLPGADRGPGGSEVVQQPGPDLLGQFGIGSPPPPTVDDDPPTVGGPRRGHPGIVPRRRISLPHGPVTAAAGRRFERLVVRNGGPVREVLLDRGWHGPA